MEHNGWRKTGRKGSLASALRSIETATARKPTTTRCLAFWFLRAERYERSEGMPFRSVRERREQLELAARPTSSTT